MFIRLVDLSPASAAYRVSPDFAASQEVGGASEDENATKNTDKGLSSITEDEETAESGENGPLPIHFVADLLIRTPGLPTTRGRIYRDQARPDNSRRHPHHANTQGGFPQRARRAQHRDRAGVGELGEYSARAIPRR